ncbi:MAG: deoxyribodipyrimidine photo-lyase, partial [Bacteroidetes bacterium]|nr:deoxyribodipyrimidine photo-lyase [Bacteroidota bacterium]
MNSREEIVIYWFRRDLRTDDNRGLRHALESGFPVLPLFIFDVNILSKLEQDDARVSFICRLITGLHAKLRNNGSGLLTMYGDPETIFRDLTSRYRIKAVYANTDYESYAIARDKKTGNTLQAAGSVLKLFSDQLVMEPGSVLKSDGKPYTVFTPFLKKWTELFSAGMIAAEDSAGKTAGLLMTDTFSDPPSPESLGFRSPGMLVRDFDIGSERIAAYGKHRDYPALNGGTGLGPHLRFGTISIREVFRRTYGISRIFTSELVWREFFMHILHFFPHVETRSFRPGYDNIEWINNEEHFNLWCTGLTGYPLVDAGMRELALTGCMHNRVRMVAAGFLVKHLLCDWRWGEAWFASKLVDYELSSNNGNWQWSAGTGCDAAPYFRVFNPVTQQLKFDAHELYIRKWIPEFGT